jgi:hypothetical protein
MDENKKANTK